MTEVGSADLSRLLLSKRNECSSIVTSRKRKLRELFAVASQVESVPNDVLANPDAPTTTAAEWQFLQANDVFQGKTFNELNVPPRPTFSLEGLKKSIELAFATPKPSPPPVLENKQKDEIATEKDGGQTNRDVLPTQPDVPVDSPTIATSTKIPSKASPSPSAAPSILKPSPQPEASVPTPSNEAATPIAPTEPSTAVPIDESSKPTDVPTNEVRNAEHAAPRKQIQVSFPPGTKGSPSEEVALTADGELDQVLAVRKPSEDGSVLVADAKSLLIEPSTNTSRAPDAVSSPESTAQSATTPAPHDVSTDTSPDNEVNHFVERQVEKEEPEAEETEKENVEVPEVASVEDLKKQVLEAPPDSAEAQLLQESIRSSAAAETIVADKDTTAPVPAVENFDTKASVPDDPDTPPSIPKDVPQPDLTVEVKVAPDASMTDEPMGDVPNEIPDSQEEPPEQMDIDVPEQPANIETQTTSSAKQENLPVTADTAGTPVPPKAALKEVALKETAPVPERAVTRVSSGAMRLKTVSEIVGDTSPPPVDRSATSKRLENRLTPVTSTPKSPGLRQRNAPGHRRDRSKGQISTVVFGKKPKKTDDKAMVSSQREPAQTIDDYYTPLFVQGFTGSSSWMQPIEKILFTANKTVATPDANLAIMDHQACKVLRRVYHLQQHDKWSLRQPKRCPEPTRTPTQWDVMIQEMKWMRTDFREEKKWKMAAAKNLAHACAEWCVATHEERKALQVPAVIPPKPEPTVDVSMADVDENCTENQPTPDLISSADVDSPDNLDDLSDDWFDAVPPSAIFTLQDDDVVFGLRRTAAAEQLLEQLPLYGKPLAVPRFDLTGPEYDPDAHWRRPALPLSKYVEGQMKLVCDGPPRKRSRYDYGNEDSDDEDDTVFVGGQTLNNMKPPPQTTEVALFNPELKHIRDRLHAGHQFRPPSEHPMPTQSFYENRSASQWTLAEDDELRNLVREYTYNWSLISSLLTSKSLFTSGAERRTPWECFERWINLEGLPSDMQKTQYFKAYNGRIEAAQRVIMQQNQIAAQQASASGGAVTPVRRRPSTPLRVERRRNQKHMALIDAMRKLAKKRETTIQKQQHNASQNAANKKTNDTISRPTKTPRDYSLLRWERDQALAEKMAQFAQRQEVQRRVSKAATLDSRQKDDAKSSPKAALQARAQGQTPQMAGNPAAAQAGQNGGHPAAAVAAAAAANGMNGVGRVNNQLAAAAAAAAAQGRPRMPMQAPTNGMNGMPSHIASGLVPPTQMNGVPQAQMQAMQGQQHRMPIPNPQPDVNLMMQARRISEQQRVAVQQMQAQQQQGGPGTPGPVTSNQQSPPPQMRNGVNGVNGVTGVNGANGMAQQNFLNNAQAMMASYNAANTNGHATPPANGLHMPSGPAGSPGARPPPQLPASIANQLAQLEATFRAKNPALTPEQLRALATEHLTRAMLAQRQSAMSAAAGANGQPGLATSIAATTSPHQYAALLRQQQQQQANQAAGSPAQHHQRQPSGSATSAGK
ncbi:Fc.00g077110.m01.CDS01 [Cosmosporella sp. VM-42]